ncbi:hypothetical protein BsWGS_00282 [Bradybaena similaris]
MPDQQIKVSRHSFSPQVNGLQSLCHQTDEIHRDFSQLMDYGGDDTSQTTLHNLCNDAFSLPMKKTLSGSLDSKWIIAPLTDQVSEFGKHNCTVPYNKKTSGDVSLSQTHSTVTAMSQRSQPGCEQSGVSRSFPVVQSIHSSHPSASNHQRCQKCAAGQPGHIQHIGQWRVIDSI